MTLVAIFLQIQVCTKLQYLDSFLDIGGHTGPIHWIVTMAATGDEILRRRAEVMHFLCKRLRYLERDWAVCTLKLEEI